MLSAAAVARLARGLGDPELPLPDFGDPAAVPGWRAALHAAWGEGTEGNEPAHRRELVAGVPVLVSGPDDAPVTVVYLHGGGYTLGSAGVAVPITARLARRLRVVSVDYRLAPEHPYPAALKDAEAVFNAVRSALGAATSTDGDAHSPAAARAQAASGANPTGGASTMGETTGADGEANSAARTQPAPGADATRQTPTPNSTTLAGGGANFASGALARGPYPLAGGATAPAGRTSVALAGDSAGGALALGVAFRLALRGQAPPDAMVLFCPHLDHHRPSGAAMSAAAAAARSYLGETPPTAPMVSPGRAPDHWLAALPPTLVQTGTLDPMWRAAARFVRQGRAAGAPLTLDLWEGLWHTWQYHRRLPEADQALAEAVAFLERPPTHHFA